MLCHKKFIISSHLFPSSPFFFFFLFSLLSISLIIFALPDDWKLIRSCSTRRCITGFLFHLKGRSEHLVAKPSYMDNRPASEYAQSGSHYPYSPSVAPSSELPAVDHATAAAATAPYTPQPEVRPAPTQYTPQSEVRPAPGAANISSSTTPQSDYGLNQPPPTAAARSPYPDYLARPPQYHHAPNTQPSGAAGMAQATSPSMTILSTSDGQIHDHHSNSTNNNMKSDTDVPIDPSIAATSPTYPPPYSPYQPQGHDMTQYQGHPPPPPPQMYARPEWPHGYQHGHHGLPGPYAAPATTVGPAFPAPAAGPRPGQVCDGFVGPGRIYATFIGCLPRVSPDYDITPFRDA